MPSEGMSDWNMYELEDIVWDVFGGSDDHIVPRPGEQVNESVSQGDSHKKARHEAGTTVGRANNEPTTKNGFQNREEKVFNLSLRDRKSPAVESSWSLASSNVFPSTCNSQKVCTIDSQDSRTSDNCCNGHKVDTGSNGFCSDDSILGDKSIADDSQECQFSLADISPEDTDLDFLESDPKDRETGDLLDYGWSDIGNFEDVDRMFRNCDSTFGQGSNGSAEELSWPYSLGDEPHASWLYPDGKKKEKFSAKQKINDGINEDEINISTLSRTRNESSMSGCQGPDMDSFQRELPRSPCQSEGRRKDLCSQYANDHCVHSPDEVQQLEKKRSFSSTALPPQRLPSQFIRQQNQFWAVDSLNYPHPYKSDGKMEYGHSPQQIPIRLLASCVKSENETNPSLSNDGSVYSSNRAHQFERNFTDPPSKSPSGSEQKMENLCHKHHMKFSEKFINQAAFTSEGPVQNKFSTSQNEIRGDNEVRTSLELPAFDIHSSTVQESSCMTSVLSDDMSLGPTSFRKLHNIMDQLDIRTKLCIRDGLYRLARSAEQRHNYDSGESRDATGILRTELKKSTGFIDVETGTNPIDRSIAHLLFHRADTSTSLVDDVMSRESHIMREQKHGPTANQLVAANQLLYQQDDGGYTDRELLETGEQ